MKKTYKLIGIALLLIIVITIFKNRPKEDLRATDVNLSDEFSKITFETEVAPKMEVQVLDFSKCEEEDGFEVESASGKNSIEIIRKEGEFCLAETTYKSGTGNYFNICEVPTSLGEVSFETANFENISQYCKISEDGSGLLELE